MIPYILFRILHGIIYFILWYVVVMNSFALLQMIAALFTTPVYISKSRRNEYRLMGNSKNMIPISLLVPAHNEEVTIVDSIKSMLNLNYSEYEIIVINDGSTDNTLDTIIRAFNLHKIIYPVREQLPVKKVRGIYFNPDRPRLKLIDKENGGKSDALNAGINLSLYPYIVSLDADSL
ncbi:MAG: glycosyltransferase family 2 protein, partial [Treponema sp.]|nr:glycosyltransferase family 2 protein [Treponema sp.]